MNRAEGNARVGVKRAYLDHAASATVRPAALAAMIERLGSCGNASSLHSAGREQRRVLEESRESLAALTGVAPTRVIFTSGGTEANNLAIKGYYRRTVRHSPRRRRIVVGATEHPSVMSVATALARYEEAEVAVAPVDRRGCIDLDALDRLLREPERVALVAIMAANNETGVIAPLASVARICRAAGVRWHCDAVQAAPWLDLPSLASSAAGVDFSMSVSGHKLGAPVGVGALLGLAPDELQPLFDGGGQEGGARPGTNPVALVASLAAAVREAEGDRQERARRVRGLRDRLIMAALAAVPQATSLTPLGVGEGLPGHALISFPGADADSLLLLLDSAGIAASAGSACSAGLTRASPVLTAMGIERDHAKAAIRFSVGWDTNESDVEHVLDVLRDAVARARAVGAGRGLTPAASAGS